MTKTKETLIRVDLVKTKDDTMLPEQGYYMALQNRDYQIWAAEAVSGRIAAKKVRCLEYQTKDGTAITDHGSWFEISGGQDNKEEAMRVALLLLLTKGWRRVNVAAPGLIQDEKVFLGTIIMRSGVKMNDGAMLPDRHLLRFAANWHLPHWMRGDVKDADREAWLSNTEALYSLRRQESIDGPSGQKPGGPASMAAP